MTGAFDPTTPNIARVYDYLLGGKDNFSPDRDEGDRLLKICPFLRDLVRENRDFITRAVSCVAQLGITQFIDLGAGLPTSPSVHQAARNILPAARVAYVDTDSVALAHARALLATNDGVNVVAADLRHPDAVLADSDLRAVIDPAKRTGVILGAVLHFLDADAARAVTAGYLRLLVPGSFLIVSCASYEDRELGKRLSAEYTAATWHNHSGADVGSFFDGLELVGPGIAEARTWRAWLPEPVPCHRAGHVLVGVGRVLEHRQL